MFKVIRYGGSCGEVNRPYICSNNGMLPTPGTYQYGTPVVVVNKENFNY